MAMLISQSNVLILKKRTFLENIYLDFWELAWIKNINNQEFYQLLKHLF